MRTPVSARPDRLLIESREQPDAVATLRPRFTWQLAGGVLRQTAWELEIGEKGREVFSSGRMAGDESVLVDILDHDLEPDTDYLVRVRVWTDGADEPSDWVDSRFRTSLFSATDWAAAAWIEPAQESATAESDDWDFSDADAGREAGPTSPARERLRPVQYLRQVIELPEGIVDARLYASARGVYDARVNGIPVSDEVLAPGYDSYQSRLSFQCHDITRAVSSGRNVLAVRLGDGWWAGRIAISGASANYGDRLQAIWQLRVRLEDGRTMTIGSDRSVRSATGGLLYSDIFIGECFDAREEPAQWDTVAFDDSAWTRVTMMGPATSELVPFVGDPVRAVRELRPRRVYLSPAGETIVDLGQNIAGRLRIRATGAAGTVITIEHSETVTRDGAFLNNIMGRNKDQTDVFVLAGTGKVEEYEPVFTYHGFQYARISGYPGTLTVDDIDAVVLSSDTPQVGDFVTSDTRMNRLHDNVVWSHRANFFSIPTDCPQRERSGWTGDAQVFAGAASNNFDVLDFYRRWLANVRAEQFDTGAIPVIVPYTPGFARLLPGDAAASTGWADAIALVPWTMYERFGDRRILQENYEAMLAWHAYSQRQAEQGRPQGGEITAEEDRRQSFLFNTGNHLGDWLAPSTLAGTDSSAAMMNAPRLTGAVMGSLFYSRTTEVVARVARVLGDLATAERLEDLHGHIIDAFAAEYISADGHIESDLQGVYVVALAFDAVPDRLREPVAQRLEELIRQNGTRLDTGFLSIPYLLDVLDRHGRTSLALELLWQDQQPSWLFEVDRGATTVWESWNAMSTDGDPQRVSFNHYAFGVVDDWLYRRIAGLSAEGPAYKRSVVAPVFDPRLRNASGRIDTPYGELAVRWERLSGTEISLTVRIPPNTSARLELPEGAHTTSRAALPPGDHVITVGYEHHSVGLPAEDWGPLTFDEPGSA